MQHSRVRIGIKRVVRLAGQADAITKPCGNYDTVSDRGDRKLRNWSKGIPGNEQWHNPTNGTTEHPSHQGNQPTRDPD
jgi:hypothetical protein